MNTKPKELERPNIEETDMNGVEATNAQDVQMTDTSEVEKAAAQVLEAVDTQEIEECIEQVPDVTETPNEAETPDVTETPNETEAPDGHEIAVPTTPETKESEIQEVEETNSLAVENSSEPNKTKKILKYLTNKRKRAVLKRAFRIWQRRPHVVAPLSESTNVCSSCSMEYQGNYCPRCGQSASIGRFSFKKALLLFLDVWGMGNRSMFRSIRDLMFRPGYMIRDYLSGMQSAYFPPFKMFFIFLTFSIIIGQGAFLNLETESHQPAKSETSFVEKLDKVDKAVQVEAKKSSDGKKLQESPMYNIGIGFGRIMLALLDKYPAIFALTAIVLFAWPLFFFIRHAPNIPDLHFSEFIVTLVYTANTFSIYLILGDIFYLPFLDIISFFMIFVALSQLSGYRKWRISGYLLLSIIISTATIILLFILSMGILHYFYSR